MSTLPVPRFAIGDKVFYVEINARVERHPCPDCCGSGKWKAIAPSGVELDMDCPRCCYKSGYAHDGLSLDYVKHCPRVRELTIGAVRINTYEANEPISYMCDETGVGSGTVYHERKLHADRATADAAAESMCAVLQAEHDARPEVARQMPYTRMGFFDAFKANARRECRAEARAELDEATTDLLAAVKAMLAVSSVNPYHDQKCAELMGEAGWTEDSDESWDEFALRIAREAIVRVEGGET